MTAVTFGRTLVDGEPIDDGVTVDAEGPTAELVAQITSPMLSNPVSGEWTAALVEGHETDGAYERGLAIYTAHNEGPPEHVHPNYEERFEVLEGEFVFAIDGTRRRLTAGNDVTVPRGTPHTFHNDSDEIASCIVETRPAGRFPRSSRRSRDWLTTENSPHRERRDSRKRSSWARGSPTIPCSRHRRRSSSDSSRLSSHHSRDVPATGRRIRSISTPRTGTSESNNQDSIFGYTFICR